MSKKATMKLCFIDDDGDTRHQYLEWAKNRGFEASAYEDVFSASSDPADVYVFDISAVCPFMIDTHHAYSPIARLMEDHPGAEIYVGSGMSRNAVEDVLDEVEKCIGRRPKFFDASSGFSGLEEAMGIKP